MPVSAQLQQPRLRPLRRNGSRRTFSLILAVVIVLIALLLEWLDEAPGTPMLPVNGGLDVFFTTPALIYPDVKSQRTVPPHLAAVLADLEAAQQTIDVAVFEYNLMEIADALAAAQERGVTVRLALDRESLEDPDDARFAGVVESAGAAISWQESTGFLHSKFIVIDEQIVWTGSWNMTGNDTFRNNNNLLRSTIPELVDNYQAEFAEMFAGRFGNDKVGPTPFPQLTTADGTAITVYFTPRDRPRDELVELLRSADSEIVFLAFSYTSDEIAEAMIDRRAAGVAVSGVFETRNAGGQGSEFEPLQNADVDVVLDGNCYTMHHKFMVIDGRYVVTGSYNFTERAESVNDENLLVIDSPALAEQYRDEYVRVREQADNPQRCGS
jgi:phosphatidylserine/phosphatidylglycerophosphate/cardiolipin synthase-like enzyme